MHLSQFGTGGGALCCHGAIVERTLERTCLVETRRTCVGSEQRNESRVWYSFVCFKSHIDDCNVLNVFVFVFILMHLVATVASYKVNCR